MKNIYDKVNEKEEEARKIKKEKIIFNGKIKFKKNIFNSYPMGWIEKFEVKDKTLPVKNGYIEIEGIIGDAGGTTKIVKNFYWEDVYSYSDGIVEVESIK